MYSTSIITLVPSYDTLTYNVICRDRLCRRSKACLYNEVGCGTTGAPPLISVHPTLLFLSLATALACRRLGGSKKHCAKRAGGRWGKKGTINPTEANAQNVKRSSLKKKSSPLLTSQMLTNDSYSADWPSCLMNIDESTGSKWCSCAATCPCQLSFSKLPDSCLELLEIALPTLLTKSTQASAGFRQP